MARAAPNQVLPSLPCTSFAPALLNTLLAPPSATISHWLWGDCGMQALALPSGPFICVSSQLGASRAAFPLLLLGPVHIPAFQPHWYTAGRGEEGKRRGSTGLGAAEVEKLVWKSSRTLFISRMLSSPSVTPGIYSGCRS